jgi:hypothetical protein
MGAPVHSSEGPHNAENRVFRPLERVFHRIPPLLGTASGRRDVRRHQVATSDRLLIAAPNTRMASHRRAQEALDWLVSFEAFVDKRG